MPVTVRAMSWCRIWRLHCATQQVTSSPGRARRKHFPSSIFLKKDFAAGKQSWEGHQTPRLPWQSAASLMDEGSLCLVLHFFVCLFVCLTTAPLFQEQRGKTIFQHNQCRFGVPPRISPGHSPPLPDLLHTVWPLQCPGEGTSLQ